MKYAIVKISGAQYKVAEGDEISVSRISGKEGDGVEFKEVYLMAEDEKIKIGRPVVEGVIIKGKIVKQVLGKKLTISKFKAKTGYRRKTGFRSKLTLVKIDKITS